MNKGSRQDNNIRKVRFRKERVGIITASAVVLTALTLTGIYMSSNEKSKNDNSVDFAKIEKENPENTQGFTSKNNVTDLSENDVRYDTDSAIKDKAKSYVDTRFVPKEMYDLSDNNDMDVEPEAFQTGAGAVADMGGDDITAQNTAENDKPLGTDKAAVYMAEQTGTDSKGISFDESKGLQWPVAGSIIMEYSMDRAVYHKTMQQYRYNPSLVIGARTGSDVAAAADGIVKEVYYDTETGNTVVCSLGNGYELTYGQLADVELKSGDRVNAGTVIGKIADPTIYYSEEGSNLYLKLTKDGEPVNPLDKLQQE